MVVSIQKYIVIGKAQSRQTVTRAILEFSVQPLLNLAERVALCAEQSTEKCSGVKAMFHTVLGALCSRYIGLLFNYSLLSIYLVIICFRMINPGLCEFNT
jgi:hypothetical protein